MSITKEHILKALSTVPDPDLGSDLVTLNMIEDVNISDSEVSFKVVLTTPACPMKDKIEKACIQAVQKEVGNNVNVKIEMTARTTSNRIDPKELLPNVKNIIAVASGKGGVGKSTVAVNIAVGLANKGAKVGLIDADIYGPSIPTMLGLRGQQPKVNTVGEVQVLKPLEAHGIKTLSFGFLVAEDQAVVWRGPMVSSAFRQFITDCDWGELDYMIIDLPPGTGDIHLTLTQTVPVTGAVVVTTPQEVALADAKKAIGMFRNDKINIPVIGVVENMSYFTPEELPNNKYYIFGSGGGSTLAQKYDIPFLGEIPLVQGIRESGDSGTPASIADKNSISSLVFSNIVDNLVQNVSILNAKNKTVQTTP